MRTNVAICAIAILSLASIVWRTDTVSARGSSGGQHQPVIASAEGKMWVDGQEVYVEVLVAAQHAATAPEEAQAALHRAYPKADPLRGAPGKTSGYTTTGLVWNALPVVVHYNDAGAKVVGAKADLLSAMATWTDVPTSSFAYASGTDTARCPSLVDECPGTAFFDGNNDVAWLDIADPSILGVTWWSKQTKEFDMAIDNANFLWYAGCSSNYSLRTVYLHELGHALGLGHSRDTSAVMYAYYSGPRCTLAQDDINGASALYPQ